MRTPACENFGDSADPSARADEPTGASVADGDPLSYAGDCMGMSQGVIALATAGGLSFSDIRRNTWHRRIFRSGEYRAMAKQMPRPLPPIMNWDTQYRWERGISARKATISWSHILTRVPFGHYVTSGTTATRRNPGPRRSLLEIKRIDLPFEVLGTTLKAGRSLALVRFAAELYDAYVK